MKNLSCKKISLLLSIMAVAFFCSQHAAANQWAQETISFKSELFHEFNVNFKNGLASLKYKTPKYQATFDFFTDARSSLANVRAAAPDTAYERLDAIDAEIVAILGLINPLGTPTPQKAAAARELTVEIRSLMYLMHLKHDVVTTEDYLIIWHNGVTHRVEHMIHEYQYEEMKWMKKSFTDEVLAKMRAVPYGADPVAYRESFRNYMDKCVYPFFDGLAAHEDPHAMVDPENAPMVSDPAVDGPGGMLHSPYFGAIYLKSFEGVEWNHPLLNQ